MEECLLILCHLTTLSQPVFWTKIIKMLYYPQADILQCIPCGALYHRTILTVFILFLPPFPPEQENTKYLIVCLGFTMQS